MSITFHVLVEQDEADWYVATCLALPGFVTQGRSRQEALANIKDAIVAWLATEDEKALQKHQSTQQQADVVAIMV